MPKAPKNPEATTVAATTNSLPEMSPKTIAIIVTSWLTVVKTTTIKK